jgi:hypothetical protein
MGSLPPPQNRPPGRLSRAMILRARGRQKVRASRLDYEFTDSWAELVRCGLAFRGSIRFQCAQFNQKKKKKTGKHPTCELPRPYSTFRGQPLGVPILRNLSQDDLQVAANSPCSSLIACRLAGNLPNPEALGRHELGPTFPN